MKSTGAVTPQNLVTQGNSNLGDYDGSGKMSDPDIKKLCSTQYKTVQLIANAANYNSEYYCQLNDVSSYSDGARNGKQCSLAYNGSPNSYSLGAGNEWNYGLGAWEFTGSVITQLNYGDERFGSHACAGCANLHSCLSSGGCNTAVWCLGGNV